MHETLYLGREWNVEHDRTVKVSGAELKYAVIGQGEPVLCIHGTTVADSLITPLQFHPELFEQFQFISYYRAGYNGSTLEGDSLSIEQGADHAAELLDHLGIDKAHILGFSFGGVIAFQFLLSHPERAATGMLLEPYLPREAPDAVQANIDAYLGAMELFQAGDKLGAAFAYMEAVCGKSFLGCVDLTGPLDVWQRVESCADTTFLVDFPAISSWGFTPSKADELVAEKPTMPILAAMGMDSESVMPGFRDTQRFLMEWLPQAERLAVPHATHGMQSMNPLVVARGIQQFMHRHPIR